MWYHGNLNDDVMNCLHSLSQWNNSIQVTNSQLMFDFHTADAIASSLLTMAVCSICLGIPCNMVTPLSWVSSQMTSKFLPHTTCQYQSYSTCCLVDTSNNTVHHCDSVYIRPNVCVQPEDLLRTEHAAGTWPNNIVGRSIWAVLDAQ